MGGLTFKTLGQATICDESLFDLFDRKSEVFEVLVHGPKWRNCYGWLRYGWVKGFFWVTTMDGYSPEN